MHRALAILLVVTAVAGVAAELPLTNADVVRLVRAGLSEQLIVTKINAAETAFDTSTDALVALAEAKVPEGVIKLMLDRTTTPSPAVAAPPSSPAATAASPAAAPVEDPAGELLQKDLPRTRGLCSALGELRATGQALVYRPTKVTEVCEEYLSSAAFEARWGDLQSVCFEYAVSGTLTLELKDGRDYSLKDTRAVMEGVEKRLRELHPELPYGCD